MIKIGITYGLFIAVVIALVNSFFVDIYGVESESVTSFLGFLPLLILAVGLFVAMRKIRKEVHQNNQLLDKPSTQEL